VRCMTDEREDSRGPGGPEPGAAPPDDEPTLETMTPTQDDDPTLETVDQQKAGDSVPETTVPKATGWAARLEQMTAARLERRHRMFTRFWLAAVPVLVLLAVAVVLLTVYGGQGAGDSVVSTTTLVERNLVEGSGLLLVAKDAALSWAVILQPWDSGGVVLAVPGMTLLESEGAFKTLTEMYRTGQRVAVEAALGQALDLSVGPVAVVEWSALQAAVAASGIEGFPVEASAMGQGEAESVAGALRTLVTQHALDGSSSPWVGMRPSGDTAEFLRAVGLYATSMAANIWTAGTLTGTVVNGDGFVYLEPDLGAAKSLLAVVAQTETLSVEVKDGAGVEGAARRAGGLLESAGFALAPMGYAQGYPGIEKTQVVVSPERAEKAKQVQSLLGVGVIVEDKTLTADRIVVVLGKDFSGESATGTQGTD
jgi:hypothetical protein